MKRKQNAYPKYELLRFKDSSKRLCIQLRLMLRPDRRYIIYTAPAHQYTKTIHYVALMAFENGLCFSPRAVKTYHLEFGSLGDMEIGYTKLLKASKFVKDKVRWI